MRPPFPWPTNEPSPSVVTATRPKRTPFWIFFANRSADSFRGTTFGQWTSTCGMLSRPGGKVSGSGTNSGLESMLGPEHACKAQAGAGEPYLPAGLESMPHLGAIQEPRGNDTRPVDDGKRSPTPRDGVCLSADWYRLAAAGAQKRVLRPRKRAGQRVGHGYPGCAHRLDADGPPDDARLLHLFQPEPVGPALSMSLPTRPRPSAGFRSTGVITARAGYET